MLELLNVIYAHLFARAASYLFEESTTDCRKAALRLRPPGLMSSTGEEQQPAGKDKEWGHMRAEEQEAARSLGWNAQSWDAGLTGPMEGRWWDTMGEDVRQAAQRLGHSKGTWDHGMTEVFTTPATVTPPLTMLLCEFR